MTPEQNRKRIERDEPPEEWAAIKSNERQAIDDRIRRLRKQREASEFFKRELGAKPETDPA